MADDGGNGGDHLDPRALGGDEVFGDGHRQRAFQEVTGECDRGCAAAECPQDVGSAGSSTAIGGQIDVAIDPRNDHAGRDRPHQVPDRGGYYCLLSTRHSALSTVDYRYVMSGHLAVVNAGGWGTALAALLGRSGH